MLQGRLDIYKEKNMTSHDVVSAVRKRFKIKQVGHSGTLDPNAEGVLNVYVGRATKFIDLLKSKDKVYEATMLFGHTSDTLDVWGNVTRVNDILVNEDELLNILNTFKGKIKQVPPMVSALKKDGKPLYTYARKGITFELEPREVEILDIKLLEFNGHEAKIYVHCSKGTYIRSLIRDIGEHLGTNAIMTSLIRLTNDYIPLSNCVKIGEMTIDDLKSLDYGLPLSKIIINDDDLRRFSQGLKGAYIKQPYQGEQVMLMHAGTFKGTAIWDGEVYRRQKMLL